MTSHAIVNSHNHANLMVSPGREVLQVHLLSINQ